MIRRELFRNLGLALLCVFIVTLLLLADLWGSILVLICVTLTLVSFPILVCLSNLLFDRYRFFQVDVAGLMHFWGLTVDTVTTVVLVLAIGLAVDYSAHMTHTFLIPNADAKTRDGLAHVYAYAHLFILILSWRDREDDTHSTRHWRSCVERRLQYFSRLCPISWLWIIRLYDVF